MLTGEPALITAARGLLKLGPRVAVVKKGEHGSMICLKSGILFCPPYPVDVVSDPTGAGDSFAGAFMACLAGAGRSAGALSLRILARACAMGSVVASFTVGSFGVKGLLAMTPGEIGRRLATLRRMVPPF